MCILTRSYLSFPTCKMAEVELGRKNEGSHLHHSYCKIKYWIHREIMFMFTNWSDQCTRWMTTPFLYWFSLHFFGAVLLWYAIFSLSSFLGRTSLVRYLFSLAHCGSCFFGMPSFLSFFRWREINSLDFWSFYFVKWRNACAQDLNQKSRLSISSKGLKIW